MPGERQWRPLDPPSQQPLTEVAMKPPQRVEIDGMLVNPYNLNRDSFARRVLPRKKGVVEQCESIVRPRFTG